LHPQAWQDLEAQMQAGHIASLKDAQAYLREHWNIVYASLNGIWHQMQRHRAKPKTGRPHHRRQQPEQQTAFKKTSLPCSSNNR
jgi:transposase